MLVDLAVSPTQCVQLILIKPQHSARCEKPQQMMFLVKYRITTALESTQQTLDGQAADIDGEGVAVAVVKKVKCACRIRCVAVWK